MYDGGGPFGLSGKPQFNIILVALYPSTIGAGMFLGPTEKNYTMRKLF